MTNLIQLQQVSKIYESDAGQFSALKNINLQIGTGEFVAIIGRSGSGKSTLLNVLTGIDQPSHGSVRVQQQMIHQMNESQLASWRGRTMGIVFQFFQLIPTLTIAENLALAMDFVNVIPKAKRGQRIHQLLQQVGIEKQANKFPASLSGGEQQRAAIARAMANKPDVIVADEPTGNLDSQTAESIMQLFKDLVDQGKTVLVVTHEQASLKHFHRVIRLHDGEIQDAASAPEPVTAVQQEAC
ncbi:MAG: ABC transporter ATP-binding protein [Gammaproteobacteria bacterium]|nr:ABC transporter ATP-binding protein [Gammaproteobacteria bacterium]